MPLSLRSAIVLTCVVHVQCTCTETPGQGICEVVSGPSAPPFWDASIDAYRKLLINFSKDVDDWAGKSRAARSWMAANDADYPLYHNAAPEGWINDPNGVIFDPADGGLYHRFYQYDKTFSDDCKHGLLKNCTFDGKAVANAGSRVWGHTVSRDGATWEDWPGIDADSKWDAPGVFSGNCVLDDDSKPVCIYSNGECAVGVCAYSSDWIHWTKAGCMTKPPSPASQTNHDSAIWRDGPGGTWYMLSGGCTYNGTNTPEKNVPCTGNAQLWNSTDLKNFTYMKPITPGAFGYWELPYMLPFHKNGTAIDNYHHRDAGVYAFLFGQGNAYYVGNYDSEKFEFSPLGLPPGSAPGKNGQPPQGWPFFKDTDTPQYYSFNPHATDTRGPNNSTRRLMFGWINGAVSAAVGRKNVPYWQSAHSLMRTVTVSGASIVQLPAAGTYEPLRSSQKFTAGPINITARTGDYLLGLKGDALEIVATFATTGITASSFGLSLRAGANFSCKSGYTPNGKTIAWTGYNPTKYELEWKADVVDQPEGKVTLHVFLDRSVVETYTGGAVATGRCFLPADVKGAEVMGVDLWAVGGNAKLLTLEAWKMSTMWKPVSRSRIQPLANVVI